MTTWYVRPPNSHSNTNNGQSYATAWEGLNTVVWDATGVTGVGPGDTLYICDNWALGGGGSTSYFSLTPTVSGTVGNPITIRGDLDGYEATLVTGVMTSSNYSWTQIGSSGTYSYGYITYGTWDRWLHDGVLLPYISAGTYSSPPTEGELTAMPEGYSYCDTTTMTRYVKLAGSANPNSEYMMSTVGGSWINLSGVDYITVLNITGATGGIYVYNANNITIDNCTITSADTGINVATGAASNNLWVKNCDISYCADGLYAYIKSMYDALIEDCSFTNILNGNNTYGEDHWDHRVLGTSVDHHAIGIMGGNGNVIRNCSFDNAETAVTLYTGDYNEFASVEVYGCIAGNMYREGDHGVAWDYHGSPYSGTDVEVKFHDNIAYNCETVGSRFSVGVVHNTTKEALDRQYNIEVYNNTFYHCQLGFAFGPDTLIQSSTLKVQNNIVLEPYLYFPANAYGFAFFQPYQAGTGIPYDPCDPSDISNNAYYSSDGTWPSTLTYFRRNQTQFDLSTWQGYGFDVDAITADPLLTDPANGDFTLTAASTAVIDKGANTGLTTDYAGNVRPIGGGYDIGAYEFISVQSAYPNTDIATTGWYAVPSGDYYATVDEETALNTDYCYTLATGQTLEFSLSALSDPLSANGHALRWRGTGEYTISLRQGSSTEIAAWYKNDGSTITDHSESLTTGQAASITDYTDLRVRIVSGS